MIENYTCRDPEKLSRIIEEFNTDLDEQRIYTREFADMRADWFDSDEGLLVARLFAGIYEDLAEIDGMLIYEIMRTRNIMDIHDELNELVEGSIINSKGWHPEYIHFDGVPGINFSEKRPWAYIGLVEGFTDGATEILIEAAQSLPNIEGIIAKATPYNSHVFEELGFEKTRYFVRGENPIEPNHPIMGWTLYH